MVTEEVMSRPHTSAEEKVRVCFGSKLLNRFLHFFDLASIEKIPSDKPVSVTTRSMAIQTANTE